MAIVGAVVLLIILVVLGGYFFYRSLPGTGDVVVPEGSAALAEPQDEITDKKVLYIRVVGESSDVLVRIPGGEVITDTTMQQGQYATYDQPRLDVTIGDPDAVEVHVNGRPKDISGEGPDYAFTVEQEG
ncbi:RodZ domain-containing protein [Marinactinospora thermotolerans]|uniref:RodZ domain-containing protein n=1 Tax=Marinactinospora thermotolerans TaxID=531310 RepID=UPI00099911A5|nr:RodZ domain-containing protein [Marinactinospora thermotolerans]